VREAHRQNYITQKVRDLNEEEDMSSEMSVAEEVEKRDYMSSIEQ